LISLGLIHIFFLYNRSKLMHSTILRKVGGSIMLAVPPALLNLLRLQPGAKVALAVDNGRVVVDPHPRPHYTLEELLAQCDSSAKPTDEDRAWLNARSVGRELP
jgi:antitoxin ChpS